MVQGQWISGPKEEKEMKKKTKKFILEFLDFWPLTIVVPLMLIGIVLGAALGWGG
jgi:hypothetical protein